MYDVKKLVLSKINNTGYKIKINHKSVKGKIYLYMNFRKMIDGKSKQQVKHLVSLTGFDKTEDLKRLAKAMEYRADYENSMRNENNVFKIPSDRIFLTDFIDKHAKEYQIKKSGDAFVQVKNQIIKCFGNQTTMGQIDKAFCLKFKEYLPTVLPKSAGVYFGKFKQVLYPAFPIFIL